jgi:hypothetical protein
LGLLPLFLLLLLLLLLLKWAGHVAGMGIINSYRILIVNQLVFNTENEMAG